MYEVGITAHFQAAHRLRGDFGPASQLHGHTYRVEVYAKGNALQDNCTLCDISALERPLHEIASSLDYRDLDDLPAFADRNTTAETLARYIYDELAPRFREQGIASLGVRVWESPFAYACYEAQLE